MPFSVNLFLPSKQQQGKKYKWTQDPSYTRTGDWRGWEGRGARSFSARAPCLDGRWTPMPPPRRAPPALTTPAALQGIQAAQTCLDPAATSRARLPAWRPPAPLNRGRVQALQGPGSTTLTRRGRPGPQDRSECSSAWQGECNVETSAAWGAAMALGLSVSHLPPTVQAVVVL